MAKRIFQVFINLYTFINNTGLWVSLLFVVILMVLLFMTNEIDGFLVFPTPTRTPLQQMLVFPEDMGWRPENKYYQLDDGIPGAPNKYLDFIRIIMTPYAGRSYTVKNGAYQSIWVYSIEDASEEFAFQEEQFDFLDRWASINFIPRTENILAGCSHARQPNQTDAKYDCDIYIQVNQYLTHATMTVDEEKITFQDWELYANLVQDRFLEYAK